MGQEGTHGRPRQCGSASPRRCPPGHTELRRSAGWHTPGSSRARSSCRTGRLHSSAGGAPGRGTGQTSCGGGMHVTGRLVPPASHVALPGTSIWAAPPGGPAQLVPPDRCPCAKSGSRSSGLASGVQAGLRGLGWPRGLGLTSGACWSVFLSHQSARPLPTPTQNGPHAWKR